MTFASPRLRRFVAPLLLAVALAGVTADAWGHHHDFGTDGVEDGEVFLCQSDTPIHTRHTEAAHPVEISLCQVCLLRAHSGATEVAFAASRLRLPDPASRVTASDPRIASLGLAGPPGSRGPPGPTVVS